MPFGLGFFAVAGAGAGGGGAFDLLETTLISSNTASVTFSSLSAYSDYKHLQIRAVMRKTDSGTSSRIRLNGDTGSNYARHRLQGNGTSVTSSGSASQTYMNFPLMPDSGMTADGFGAIVVDVLDFSSSSKNTTIRSFGGYTVSDGQVINLDSGFWNNTAAVTSIEFSFTAGSIEAESRFSLYGVK